jgi:hypothetical protein
MESMAEPMPKYLSGSVTITDLLFMDWNKPVPKPYMTRAKVTSRKLLSEPQNASATMPKADITDDMKHRMLSDTLALTNWLSKELNILISGKTVTMSPEMCG